MASGKKGKKTKGKTVPLTDFLQQSPGTAPSLPIRKTTNWADDEVDDDVYDSRSKINVVLPTAPKASRGYEDFADKIPNNPPYMAYLSNLPYDVTDDEIESFFSNLRISNMRIPREDRLGEVSRLRGFGYIEFEDRDSLIGALTIPDCTLKNRTIRIEVANPDDRRRGGRMDSNRDRYDRADRPEVPTGDWRSGPRSDLPEQRNRNGGGGFSRDRDRDGDTIERGGGGGGGSWRDNPDRSSFRDNPDRPSFRDNSDRPSFRDNSDRPSFRDSDRDKSYSGAEFDRSNFGRDMRRDDRSFSRDDRSFGRDGGDRRRFGDRRDDRDMSRTSDRNFERADRSEADPPRVRQKIVLAPRTKPLDPTAQPEPEKTQQVSSAAAAPPPASSIFGQAKPVDTAARERQIEELISKQNEKGSSDTGREPRQMDRRDWGRRGDYKRSPDRNRRSPDRNRRSPDRNRRSPDRYRRSPDRNRRSPDGYRRSPDGYRRSPGRKSPDRSRRSPDGYRRSPDRRQNSPHHSPGARFDSNRERRDSYEDRKRSPDRSPSDRRSPSPDRRRRSPDVSPDRRASPTGRDKWSGSERKDRRSSDSSGDGLKNEARRDQSKEVQEKEMPKLKQPEPPNFVASNKYAHLNAEDDDHSD